MVRSVDDNAVSSGRAVVEHTFGRSVCQSASVNMQLVRAKQAGERRLRRRRVLTIVATASSYCTLLNLHPPSITAAAAAAAAAGFTPSSPPSTQ